MSDPLNWLWEVVTFGFYVLVGLSILIGVAFLIIDIGGGEERQKQKEEGND